MSKKKLFRASASMVMVLLVGVFMVACDSDDNADGSKGDGNAPTLLPPTQAPTKEVVEGGVAGETEPTEPVSTVELQEVPGTPPAIRRGSSGDMATNARTPEASPGASPEASPAASPEGN